MCITSTVGAGSSRTIPTSCSCPARCTRRLRGPRFRKSAALRCRPDSCWTSSARAELREAESLFRRAVAHAPAMAEAHLRLGRVIGVQGRAADALAELQQALTLLDDEELWYDGELFVGAMEEALGRYDAAAAAYERAAIRYPGAQSPLFALSQLARRRGDRAAALAAIERVFELPPPGDDARQD